MELAELAEEIRNVVRTIAPTGVASQREVNIWSAAETRSAVRIIASSGVAGKASVTGVSTRAAATICNARQISANLDLVDFFIKCVPHETYLLRHGQHLKIFWT